MQDTIIVGKPGHIGVGSSSASPQTIEESESRSPTPSEINRLSGSVCTEAQPDDGDWKVSLDSKLTPAASPSVQDTLVIATAMAVAGTEGKYDFVLAVAGTERKYDLKARQE